MRNSSLLIPLALLAAHAQTAQDVAPQVYRAAYRAWREADPGLEKDAALAVDLVARAQKVSQASTAYSTARGAYLRHLTEERADMLQWLQNSGAVVELDLAPASEMQALVTTATNFVSNDIASYAGDPDKGLQPLRQALDREKAALAALSAAIGARQAAQQRSTLTLPGTETARAATLSEYQKLYNASTAATSQADRESAAWATYYQVLSEAPKGMVETGRAILISRSPEAPNPLPRNAPNPNAPEPIVINGVRIMNPAKPLAAKQRADTAAAQPPPISTAPSVPVAALTPKPESKFAGGWVFPATGGIFHGREPETVELQVTEDDTQLSGILSIRFKTASPAAEDPLLLITFRGRVGAGRNQVFELETADGAKGNLELIPGPTSNQLEVNFLTEPQPRKIRAGNFLLVRK